MEREYTIAGNHLMLTSEHTAKVIEQKVLGMLKRGGLAYDYGDFKCNTCGNEFRRYGNGELHLGMIPRCPKCGGYCSEI